MPNLGAIGSNATFCEFSYEIDQIRSICSGAEDNSDQHQFSPNKIHTLSRDKVMRINKMITQLARESSSYYQILPTNSLRKCMEISLENLYVDTGA